MSHLVNLTILATDKKGNPVANLKAEEIEVLEDGVAQKLSSFEAALAGRPAALSAESPPVAGSEKHETRGAAETRPRYIAFVVDNSATDFVDRQRALAATRQWLETRQRPSDLVALASLGIGVRMWQTFTAERDRLLGAVAAMERESVPPRESQSVDRFLEQLGQCTSMERREMQLRCGESAAQSFTTQQTGMLNRRKGVLKALIERLAPFPGEKRVVYLGDGFPTNPGMLATKAYTTFFGDDPMLMSLLNTPDDLRQVTSAALRANVTLFTIDAHGLRAVPPRADASQFAAPRSKGPFATGDFENERAHGTEDSLSLLAANSGGRMFYGNNDLAHFADQAVGSIEGTYYASYVPENRRFDGRYRKISIRSLRPGAVVETRPGYFAVDVYEIPLETKVSEPAPREGWYLVTVSVHLAEKALAWNGRGEKKNDEVTVTRTVANSKGELVSSQAEFASLTLKSPQIDVAWLLTPGHYTCTITVTEVATGNFGTTTFPVAVLGSQGPRQ